MQPRSHESGSTRTARLFSAPAILLLLFLSSVPARAESDVLPSTAGADGASSLAGTPNTSSRPNLISDTADTLLPGRASILDPDAGLCQPACDKRAPFTPFMLGDFIGPLSNLLTDIKVAEGESPRPMDRVFLKLNYYNNLDASRWSDPAQPIRNVGLYTYTFGFEKTFMDRQISIGVRLPFYTVDAQGKDVTVAGVTTPGSGQGFTSTQLGNLSAVLKGVVWEDKNAGSLVSGGVMLTMPTASSQNLDPGISTLAFMQPFGAYIFSSGDFFVQGFSSMTLPLARPESLVLFNDVGIGYFAYRNSGAWLTAVIPTVEVHVNTPLRQASPTVNIFGLIDNLRIPNTVNLTFGSTFEFSSRSTLGAGVTVPVTGSRSFDIEGVVQMNYRF